MCCTLQDFLGGYLYCARKAKPDWLLIGALTAFVIFLTWRLYPVKIYLSDDVSHWALVARHLLRTDAFPDASVKTVFFQSYPLGSAAFIYYVGRTLRNVDGIWLIAQDFLFGVAFLPLLSHIRGNKHWLWLTTSGLFFVLFGVTRRLETLQVDWLLGFWGIGLMATVTRYSANWKKATLAVLPSLIAVVYLKSSGMFFALLAVLYLAYLAWKENRKLGLVVFLVGAVAVIGAYGLWTLHVKMAFPVGMHTKHAISVSDYVQEASSKDIKLIATVLFKMLLSIAQMEPSKLLSVFMVLGSLVLFGGVSRIQPNLKKVALKSAKLILYAVCIYVVWNAMIFLMYVVSMPAEEAERLASYSRYNRTGRILLIGMVAIAAFDFISRIKGFSVKKDRALFVGVVTMCVVSVCILFTVRPSMKLLARSTAYVAPREKLCAAQERIDIQPDGKYMIYWRQAENNTDTDVRPSTLFYHVKYEYDTTNVITVMEIEDAQSDEAQYTFVEIGELADVDNELENSFAISANQSFGDDPVAYIAAHIDECDALIIADEDPEFEAQLMQFMQEYEGDTPVCFAYKQ